MHKRFRFCQHLRIHEKMIRRGYAISDTFKPINSITKSSIFRRNERCSYSHMIALVLIQVNTPKFFNKM